MDDYDNPWKEILDSFFESFVEFFFPQAYNEIDWSRGFESLDTELRQIVREAENRRRTVDKLVKVWLKSGQAEWILVHIEVQTQEADDFEERMFVYISGSWPCRRISTNVFGRTCRRSRRARTCLM